MAKCIYFIYDLPFQPRRELCTILDADRRWEELGGIHMEFDVTTLTLIGQAIYRDKSPTWELLNKFSERNGTIKQLFIMLAKMDYQRGLVILSPYVDEKYHQLITEKSLATSAFSPQKFDSSFKTKVFSPFSSLETTKTVRSPRNEKTSSSFKNNSALNLNQNSNVDHSKLNSLNTRYQPKVNKDLDVRNFKDNDEESISDNCAPEKMKSIQKVLLAKEKDQKQSSTHYALENMPDVMKVSYEELKLATDNFSKTNILGRGGFGAVYKGKWKGTSVAIKRLMSRDGRQTASRHHVSLRQSLNELNILTRCRYDFILPLYGISLDGPEPCLVYQYMANGSLEDRLLCRHNSAPLTWSHRSHIAECTCKGLNYLHTYPGKQLIHGDIKSANILLDVNMEAKIGDFGLTREGPSCDDTHVKVSKLHGTQYYLPPEYLRQHHLSPQVDVFSYGIVLLEMATGLRPYDVSREDAKLLVDYVNDCHSSGRLDTLRDPKAGEENMMWFGELVKIGQECSTIDKKKRPSMQYVLDCFEKIKNELSMVDKMRRLSSDRGSASDISKLKQLTPFELQIFYDMYKEKHGVLPSSGMSSLQPNDIMHHISGFEEIQGSLSEACHLSKIRELPSSDGASLSGVADHLPVNRHLNNDLGAAACQALESDDFLAKSTLESNLKLSEGKPVDCKVPLPNLSVLQLQISEIEENSNANVFSEVEYNQSQSNIYEGYSSNYTDYSQDFVK